MCAALLMLTPKELRLGLGISAGSEMSLNRYRTNSVKDLAVRVKDITH